MTDQVSFWSWWTACQPPWRGVINGHPKLLLVSDIARDWEALLVGGNNGVMCVMMALYWWGKHLAERDGADITDWLNAMKDVDSRNTFTYEQETQKTMGLKWEP
ncbi:hypothetical protein BS47DRAFT_1367451 [Hydnum rufescens UP504]|uniref:Uncharacterized protein n=1 Tax=Hydnum rufescens UP504 TaxID=1448309 RepID=A0A9P6DKR5_9AGAM|nr:hypothetical protein BS47DRAFT_1367451 [Hydnum rufescens UP504]